MTAVPAELLAELNEQLLRIPEDFTVYRKLVRYLEVRRESFASGTGINWAHAEALAFAALLREGHPSA